MLATAVFMQHKSCASGYALSNRQGTRPRVTCERVGGTHAAGSTWSPLRRASQRATGQPAALRLRFAMMTPAGIVALREVSTKAGKGQSCARCGEDDPIRVGDGLHIASLDWL